MEGQMDYYHDSYSMLVMNKQSEVRRLYTPFSVLSIESIDEIKMGCILCVDEIYNDEDDIILYKIMGNLYAYRYFIITDY
jgi:hypothetical protein